ncbi:MAG TPA: hypothetical protein VKU02_00030 [Gemmataceae bacterium]|nr:hypothetical protein [Gemmataceae bacterium]
MAHPKQIAYRLAKHEYEAAKKRLVTLLVARNVCYDAEMTEPEIDAMCKREIECECASGYLFAQDVLNAAEKNLIAWGRIQIAALPDPERPERKALELFEAARYPFQLRDQLIEVILRLPAPDSGNSD